MKHSQADLFAEDNAERNKLPEAMRATVRARLEATLAHLEALDTFPWVDPPEAVHVENRFQRDAEKLGDEGAAIWARFDREMDRLYAAAEADQGSVGS